MRQVASTNIAMYTKPSDGGRLAILGIYVKWASPKRAASLGSQPEAARIRPQLRKLQSLDPQTVGFYASLAHHVAERLASEWCRDRVKGWLGWLKDAAKGHGRMAYKYLKSHPTVALDPATVGGLPQPASEQVKQLAATYGTLWSAKDERRDLSFRGSPESWGHPYPDPHPTT